MTQSADKHRFKVLRLLEVDPDMSQRELAEAMGVSVGNTNGCIPAPMSRQQRTVLRVGKGQDS